MKVLYLAASGEVGGGNRSLLSIWPLLVRRGIDIQVICPDPGPMLEACRDLRILCDVVDFAQPEWRQPVRLWTAHRRWLRILRAAAPNVVHSNSLRGARSVSFASRRLGIPLICHVRFPPDADTARWMFRGLPKPDVFVFNSRALRSDAGGHLAEACPQTEQRTVYNAVDLDAFRPRPPGDHPMLRVGIIANLSAIKGHADFLRMAKTLVDRAVPCEFWIVGTDLAHSGYEQYLVSLVAEMNIAHVVRFLGFRSDVADLIGQLDIVVSSSHYESFGRTLLEAAACARPVVATDVGGVAEVVEDGVTGVLVRPQDPDALAAAVERLAYDAPLRERMARAGRRRAVERFSADICANQMIEMYTRLASRRRPRARDAQRPIRVVFRYDDCSARSSLDLERRLVGAFAACGAQVTFGVIPKVVEGSLRDRGPQRKLPLPSEKVEWLKSVVATGHVEIALHGYSHQLVSDAELSEFAGCAEMQQAETIAKGKAELETLFDGSLTTFIPPWNSYDVSTLRVLQRHGFTCLSASVRGPFAVTTSLDLLPACCSLDGLEHVVRVAHVLRRARPVIVVTMHDYDFFESGSYDAWLSVDDFALRLRELYETPDVRLYSLQQACADGAAARSPAVLEPHRIWWTRIQRLSWRYRSVLSNQVLWGGRGSSVATSVWLRQSCVSAYCLWHNIAPSVKRRLFAQRFCDAAASSCPMEPTPYEAPTPTPPRANSLARAFVAIVIERRLPYRVSLVIDRLANRLGFRQKTVRSGRFAIRVRRLTSDERFIENVIVNREYTSPGFEIHETDTVIDIGGNIGTFSLFASACALRGRVLCFEPDAENYTLLMKNIATNSRTNVLVRRAAVAGGRGTVRLFTADQGGFHSVLAERAADLLRFEDVEAVGLKDIFDEYLIERCHFLKLDCEGAEYDILYALPAEYYSRIDRIVMEYHGVEDPTARRVQSDGLIAHLERSGFRIESYREFGPPFRGGMIRASKLTMPTL